MVDLQEKRDKANTRVFILCHAQTRGYYVSIRRETRSGKNTTLDTLDQEAIDIINDLWNKRT